MKQLNLSLYILCIFTLFLSCNKQEIHDISNETDTLILLDETKQLITDRDSDLSLRHDDKNNNACCNSYSVDITPGVEQGGCCTYQISITNSSNCTLTLTDNNGNVILSVGPQTGMSYLANVCNTTHYQIRFGNTICETISLQDNCNILGDECCDVEITVGDVPIGGCCLIELQVYNYGGCPLFLVSSKGKFVFLGSAPYKRITLQVCENQTFDIINPVNQKPCISFDLKNCWSPH